jgi:hypothetical protein
MLPSETLQAIFLFYAVLTLLIILNISRKVDRLQKEIKQLNEKK